jgi:hypothetical protein
VFLPQRIVCCAAPGYLRDKSPLILQPGPATLTDGLAALQRIIGAEQAAPQLAAFVVTHEISLPEVTEMIIPPLALT